MGRFLKIPHPITNITNASIVRENVENVNNAAEQK